MTHYTRLEIHGGPDEHGRYHYALYWTADYHPGHPGGEYRRAERGQECFDVLPPEFRATPPEPGTED